MVDNIKEKIKNLGLDDLNPTSLSNLDLISDISSLTDETEKEEMVDLLSERAKEILDTMEDNKTKQKASKDAVIDTIEKILGEDNAAFYVTELNANYADFDPVGEDEDELISEEELTRINARINELEGELKDFIDLANDSNMTLVDYLQNEINKLKTTNTELKKIDEQIAIVISEFKDREALVSVEDIKNDILELEKEQKDIVAKSGGYPSEEDDKRYHEINKIILELKKDINYINKYSSKTNDELQSEFELLEIEQKDIVAKSGGYPSEEDDKRYHEINNLKKYINKELIKREKIKYDKYSDDELKKEIEKLESEQKDIVAKSGGYPSEEDDKRYHEINNLVSGYRAELKRREDDRYIKLTEQQINELIEKLVNEQKDIVAKSGGYPSEEDDKRYHEINKMVKDLKSEIEKRKNDLMRSIYSMNKRELENKLKELEENKKNVQSTMNKNNNDLNNKLDKAKELEDLKNRKPKKIDEKKKREDLRLKGLKVLGFLGGLGFSCIPGVCPIMTTASIIKLGSKWGIKAVKFVDNKFLNGKIKSFINPKVKNFEENHKNIVKIIANIRKFLANDYVNATLNGFSIGYLLGNIYEMYTNETVLDTLKGAFEKDVSTNVVADANTYGSSVIHDNCAHTLVDGNDTASIIHDNCAHTLVGESNVVENVVDKVTNITLEPGASYNLDGLVRGFVSSDATESVHLMSGVSDNLIFDRIVNGRAHFLQPNGQGMAWYDLKEVEEYLAKMAEVAGKTR